MSAAVEIKNPGHYQVSSRTKGLFFAAFVVGALLFVLGLVQDAERAWYSFVWNQFFFMSLAVGGLVFTAIQFATSAMWSAAVRRIMESFTAYLPVAIVMFVVLAFGIHHLYHWSHTEAVMKDMVLSHKSGYLNTTFFVIRSIVVGLLFLFFAHKIVGNSLAQDQDGNIEHTNKNKVLSPIFLIVFALGYTLLSFDHLMSLDAHWFSTMFGVYNVAGMFYSTLALICLIAIWLRRAGALNGIVTDEHLHGLGKFMFGFTVFWAYIGFSQFLLIWYANLPEETGYFIRRFEGGWFWVSVFLIVGKFVFPFLYLLPVDQKRKESSLVFIGIYMLICQWIDVGWMVQPEYSPTGPSLSYIELGTLVGFIGLFGLTVTRFMGRHNILAVGDPRLAESLVHHQ